jgi:hypothetical protein
VFKRLEVKGYYDIAIYTTQGAFPELRIRDEAELLGLITSGRVKVRAIGDGVDDCGITVNGKDHFLSKDIVLETLREEILLSVLNGEDSVYSTASIVKALAEFPASPSLWVELGTRLRLPLAEYGKWGQGTQNRHDLLRVLRREHTAAELRKQLTDAQRVEDPARRVAVSKF